MSTAEREGLRIFISYRREDTEYPAGRLYDALITRFNEDQVFMDIDTIDLGTNFVQVIKSAVGSCDVLIAVIGNQWLSAKAASGHRRLDNPEDFVRLEVQEALERHDVRVIPVLVQGARMPSSDELPEPIAPLARRNALDVTSSRWRYDVGRLISTLENLERDKGEPKAREEQERKAREEQEREEPVAVTLINRGVELGTQGRYEEAIAAFDEVIGRFRDATEPGIRAQVHLAETLR